MADFIEWSDRFATGIAKIDHQHQQLFRLINDFYATLQKGEAEAGMAAALGPLFAYAKYHFATEENYFELYAYLGKEEHKLLHERFRAELEKWKRQILVEKSAHPLDFLQFLSDWLCDHIMTRDPEYVSTLKPHLQSESPNE